DSPLILEKLRWESGPASTPNPEEVIPILEKAQWEIEDCENQIKTLESRKESLRLIRGPSAGSALTFPQGS
ncbi:hypothetical protein BT96DRAFT_923953, partial [Gymnopus androsaceus JB14]